MGNCIVKIGGDTKRNGEMSKVQYYITMYIVDRPLRKGQRVHRYGEVPPPARGARVLSGTTVMIITIKAGQVNNFF